LHPKLGKPNAHFRRKLAPVKRKIPLAEAVNREKIYTVRFSKSKDV